ncbi:hypothetical protein AMTRI_Chr12g268450 [Amborella trichopoda]
MEVKELEKLLRYRFRDPQLLKDVVQLINSSSSFSSKTSQQERLKFIGHEALAHVFIKLLFKRFPSLTPRELSLFRAANTSTEKLAMIAVKHGFCVFLLQNSPTPDDKVSEFIDAINESPDNACLMKTPKVLADMVESIVGAVYVDTGYNLEILWNVFHDFFEPIVTPSTLKNHSVTELQDLTQKQGKQVKLNAHKRKVRSYYGPIEKASPDESKHGASPSMIMDNKFVEKMEYLKLTDKVKERDFQSPITTNVKEERESVKSLSKSEEERQPMKQAGYLHLQEEGFALGKIGYYSEEAMMEIRKRHCVMGESLARLKDEEGS